MKFNERITNLTLKRYLINSGPKNLKEGVKHACDWELIERAVSSSCGMGILETVAAATQGTQRVD